MADPQVFHFSDDPAIAVFEPRPVRTPAERPPGMDWLNGPLVWAIDDWHAPMYFFPRDCPRVLLWRLPGTTDADLDRWWRGDRAKRMQAHIEAAWLERQRTAHIWRYTLPREGFEYVGEIGTWVSHRAVKPLAVEPVGDLTVALTAAEVELHVMDDLLPLKGVWDSSLHASGIRLRNARDWGEPGWPHSRPRTCLTTPRLVLRPFELGDAERVADIVSNWNVGRMLRMAPWPPTLENQRAWLATHAEEWRSGEAYRFAVIRQGVLIGCADVDNIEGGDGEVGYWFDEAAWGAGYATEAARAVMDFARNSLGVTRFRSGHAADNPASGHVLEKLGFQRIDETEVFSKSRQAMIRQVRYALGRPAAA